MTVAGHFKARETGDNFFVKANCHENTSAAQGSKRKAMGVRAGDTDLEFIPHNGKPTIRIELKLGKGRLSPEQKQFFACMDALKQPCYLIKTDDRQEAIELITAILKKHGVRGI